MGHRRIVVDCSVIVAGLLRETMPHAGGEFDVGRRAEPLLEAIERGRVAAFAPELLRVETLQTLADKAHGRARATHPREQIDDCLDRFLAMPITYVPGRDLYAHAREWTMNRRLAPGDSWYAACAWRIQGELWITHDQQDRFGSRAKAVGIAVRLLTEQRFGL